MGLFQTFYRYIARQYIFAFMVFLMVMVSIVFMFDMIELLRRSASRDVPLSSLFELALLKIPEVSQKLFPFAILFSAIYTFWRMTKNNELIVARAAGFSIWQFISPVMSVALLIGILKIMLINPVSSVFLAKFERMEAKYFDEDKSLIDITENGLWLKQTTGAKSNEIIFLQAESFDAKTLSLNHVLLLGVENDRLVYRYDIEKALLEKRQWRFLGATYNDFQNPPVPVEQFTMPTLITAEDIQDSFASPDSISFWKLPQFIKSMEDLGFPTVKLRIYLQSLLANPVLYIAMVLLAASVSLRPPRRGGVLILISAGIFIGFIIFIMDNFLQAYAISEQIPVTVAAWITPLVSFVFGLSALLYLEENA